MDSKALKAELLTDPASLGYGALIAVAEGGTAKQGTSDAGLAALLNAIGKNTVKPLKLTGDQCRKIIMPCVIAMPSASAQIQAKWQPLLNLVAGVQFVDNDAEFAGVCAGLVTDFASLTGVNGIPAMNQARIDSLASRPGSRAEVLFGVDVLVGVNDISLALRGR